MLTFGFRGGAYGFTIGDAGFGQLSLNAVLILQLGADNVQMHLAKAAEQHVAGFGILFKGDGGILFKQLVQPCENLVLVALLLGGYCQGYGGGGEVYGGEGHGGGRIAKRVAGGGELKLCKRAYIARDELIDLNGLFAAHNEYVAALLGLFIVGIVKRGGGIEHAGMYLYYGILAELVHNGLYDLACELAVIGHADGVAVRIGSGGGLNFGSGGHIMHQIVQQRGNAYVGRSGAAAHGGDYAFLNAVAQACEYFFAAELAFFEELLHQRFVGFGGGLGQRFVNALRLGFHVGGNGYFLFALAVELLGSHVGNVNVTHELAAFHYGQLYGNHAGAELFVYLGHGLGEVGVFAIHLVHDHHAGLAGLFAHVHGLFNAYHGAGYGAHDYKGGIRQGHCGADFAIEIEEAGGIDNVDLGVLPLKGSEGGVDGNGTLDLLRIEVGRGGAVFNLAQALKQACVEEHSFGKGGLAFAAVAEYAYVADVCCGVVFHLASCCPFQYVLLNIIFY